MDVRDGTIRVLMLPWLAHGHISPFLELAKKLSERNFCTFLCSTPVNLAMIKNRVTEKYSQSIHLMDLHLPSSPELPPKHHTTNGLPPHLNVFLRDTYEKAGPTIIAKVIESVNPDVIIYDQHQPHTPGIAASLNIPAVQFVISGAAMFSFMMHMFIKGRSEKYPFPEIHVKKFDHLAPRGWAASADDGKNRDRVLGSVQRSEDIVLISSFREMEGKYLDHLDSLLGKKMVPVGPLIRDSIEKDDHSEIITWLDNKDKSSTVFVSFGSECYLTKDEIFEIAHGLELSNVNFIWVLRSPAGEEKSLEEQLPEGFLERVGDRGIVMDGWAPQPGILKHPSTGGFVCHCGWNSVIEGMKFGVPMITMPMHLEQPLNARLVGEIGMGVEVEKDGDVGVFKGEEIARVIRSVVVDGKGDEGIKGKAKEWREKMRLKGDEEIDEVVEELVKLCKKRSSNK